MSYLDDESSIAGSQPVELYKFDGTFVTYYYTSGPKIVSYDDGDGSGPQNYVPIAIERTEVKGGTQDDDGLDITVSLPATEMIVQDYGFGISPPKLTLTIYRMEPTGTIVYWIGPVTNINVDQSEDGRAAIKCPSVLGAALVGNVPDVYYQTPCNHTLYDARCGVDYASNSAIGTVTSISADGKTIGVNTIGSLDGKLIGGELALGTGEVRMIVAQAGTSITVNFPYSNIEVGGAMTIAAGCDYAYTGDCKVKFDNQERFGGFVFIPPINPFLDGIEPAEAGVTDDACVFVHEGTGPNGFWGAVRFEFTHGEITPAEFPGINLSHSNGAGGYIATSDGPYWKYFGGPVEPYGSAVRPPCTAMEGYFLTHEAAALHGWNNFVDDPFTGGTPIPTFNTLIQFSFYGFSDAFHYGGSGLGRAFFRYPNGPWMPMICVQSGTPDFFIGELWPEFYDFVIA